MHEELKIPSILKVNIVFDTNYDLIYTTPNIVPDKHFKKVIVFGQVIYSYFIIRKVLCSNPLAE